VNAVSRLAGEDEVTVVNSTGLQFMDKNDDKSKDESLYANDGDDDGDGDDGYEANESDDQLCESGSVTSQGSVTVENDLDGSFYVRSLGSDDICFDGEIGCWKASLVNSPIVDVAGIRGSGTELGTPEEEKVEFHAIVTFTDNAEPLEVPEEYDRYSVDQLDGRVTEFAGRNIIWEAQGVG